MTPRQDFLIDEDWDLVIENDTIKIGKSDDQHVRLLLDTYRKNWTQFPNFGLGLGRFLNGNLGGEFRREFKLQMASDSYDAKILTVTPLPDGTYKTFVKYELK
jgi:hypothetical protein